MSIKRLKWSNLIKKDEFYQNVIFSEKCTALTRENYEIGNLKYRCTPWVSQFLLSQIWLSDGKSGFLLFFCQQIWLKLMCHICFENKSILIVIKLIWILLFLYRTCFGVFSSKTILLRVFPAMVFTSHHILLTKASLKIALHFCFATETFNCFCECFLQLLLMTVKRTIDSTKCIMDRYLDETDNKGPYYKRNLR